MTILLTRFEENEIYMMADGCITDSETGENIRTNQLKLTTIPNLNAGISWYGRAKIDGKTTTKWLEEMFKEVQSKTISEFAKYLLDKLNKNFRTPIHSGFHITGFEQDGTPKFHHITNNHINDIVSPDIKTKFIDSGLEPEKIKPNNYIINGSGFAFNVLVQNINMKELEQSLSSIIDNIKYNLQQRGLPFNFDFDDSPNGKINKMMFYLHITQWFHLYSDGPDIIAGKYSSLIIYKSPPHFDFKNNGNKP